MKLKLFILIAAFFVTLASSTTPIEPAGSIEYSLLLAQGRYFTDQEYAKGVDYAYDYYLYMVNECRPVTVHIVDPGTGGIKDDDFFPTDDGELLLGYTYQCDNFMLNTYFELLALYKSYTNTSYNQGLKDGLMAVYVDKVQHKISIRS